jgi:predicted anti-sigma-YlaC factor YlaD
MLTCREFLEGALCDYLDGTQDHDSRAEVERHLQKCGKCRIVCETTRQTVMLYRRMAAVCTIPAEVEARLFSVIEKLSGRNGHSDARPGSV